MTELKRCPFCGAEAELVRNSSGSYFARCTNKQCAAKTRLYHENEVGARIAWNKRAEPTCDRDALLALADRMDDRAHDWDVTYHGAPLVHAGRLVRYAERIREACGEEAKDEA